MLDSKNLLEKFLGPNAADFMRETGSSAKQQLDGMGMGGFGGGAVVGGLLGLMLGGKKMKKMAGYGGAAALPCCQF